MTSYFNGSGVDTSDIQDTTQIDADDVKAPLDNLVSAIETMDGNLDTVIGDHESRLTTVEGVVMSDKIDLPILTSTPSNPASDYARFFLNEAGASSNLVPQLNLLDENGGVHPLAHHNKAYDFTVIGSTSTTSTSFVQIPGAELTLDVQGGDVQVVLMGPFRNATTFITALFIDFLREYDSTTTSVSNGGGIVRQIYVDNSVETITAFYIFRDLPAGEHTFYAHWYVTSGTGSIDVWPARFWAREL